MKNGIHLSIIVTSWNTKGLTRATLRSIFAHPPADPFEVIVVENASSDGSADMVALEFPSVNLLRNGNNEGYARGNNQGFACARGNVILFLGSDTVIPENSIQRMLEYLAAHPEAGAVGCRLLNPDMTLQRSCRRFPTLLDGVLTYLSLHSLARRYNGLNIDYGRTQEVDQPAATCFMVRREVLAQVGAFDERYTILYNDVDLCRRIRKGGWKIIYLAEAQVVHHGSQSTRQATPEVRLEMYRNILIYYFGEYGFIALVCLLPILMVRLAIVNRGKRVPGLLDLRYLAR
jgi:GT2 family glycosyltransferase